MQDLRLPWITTHFTGGINQPVERFAGCLLTLPPVRDTLLRAALDPTSYVTQQAMAERIAFLLRTKTCRDAWNEEFCVLEKRVIEDLTSKITKVPSLASKATSASEGEQKDVLQLLDVWFRCSTCEQSMPPWKIYAHACFVYNLKTAAGRKVLPKEASIVGWSPERLTPDLHAIGIHDILRTIVETACRVDTCLLFSDLTPDRKPFPFTHETLCTTEWHFRCQVPKCSSSSTLWSSVKFVSTPCMVSSDSISANVPLAPYWHMSCVYCMKSDTPSCRPDPRRSHPKGNRE